MLMLMAQHVTLGGNMLSFRAMTSLDPAMGPRGYRVHCIDYDSTNDTYYDTAISETEDLFEKAPDDELLGNPNFTRELARTRSRTCFCA